jgi:hypothetical protein
MHSKQGGDVETSRAMPQPGKRKLSRHVEHIEDPVIDAKRPRPTSGIQVTVSRSHVNPQRCPFPACKVKSKKIERHVQQAHLLKVFNDVRPIRSLGENELCSRQIRALVYLVKSVLGHAATLASVVDYINNTQKLPPETTLHQDTVTCIRRLCRFQEWEEPSCGFTIAPVNSPAVLIYWRCLVILMLSLQPAQHDEFRV